MDETRPSPIEAQPDTWVQALLLPIESDECVIAPAPRPVRNLLDRILLRAARVIIDSFIRANPRFGIEFRSVHLQDTVQGACEAFFQALDATGCSSSSSEALRQILHLRTVLFSSEVPCSSHQQLILESRATWPITGEPTPRALVQSAIVLFDEEHADLGLSDRLRRILRTVMFYELLVQPFELVLAFLFWMLSSESRDRLYIFLIRP